MKRSKKVIRIGIDLGKNVFHLYGVDRAGHEVVKRKLRRSQLTEYIANLPSCLIGMEACGGSNHWVRRFEGLGHDVRLMDPRLVKPYVKGHKNDYNDAEGICEAVSRPNMRFVTPRSVEQQDLQALHRIRQAAIKQRTVQANQIPGLLGEYGIVMAQGIGRVRRGIPEILEEGENGLSARFRDYLAELYRLFLDLDARIQRYDAELERIRQTSPACRGISAIEGIGPITATAVIASYGDCKQFRSGREFAASLGLVPRQHTTGGKPVLLGISKRGDCYLRTLLIHGARAVISGLNKHPEKDAGWLCALIARRGENRAAVALANKHARIIWALLTREETYRGAAWARAA